MMDKAPNIYRLEDLKDCVEGKNPLTYLNGKWVPVRPVGRYGFWNRLTLAVMVFCGDADVVVWPEGQ